MNILNGKMNIKSQIPTPIGPVFVTYALNLRIQVNRIHIEVVIICISGGSKILNVENTELLINKSKNNNTFRTLLRISSFCNRLLIVTHYIL
jgi:hypothetical protein